MTAAQSAAPARAADICRKLELSEEATGLLDEQLTPTAYLERLADKACYRDAFQVLAHWLSRREAIWWGCLCLWLEYGPQPPGPIAEVFRVTVRWLLDPKEEQRRAAEPVAAAAGLQTPPGLLAQAILWSGGSMHPPNLPPVPPPPLLTARTVATAVLLASIRKNPVRTRQHSRVFVRLGLQVRQGLHVPEPTNKQGDSPRAASPRF